MTKKEIFQIFMNCLNLISNIRNIVLKLLVNNQQLGLAISKHSPLAPKAEASRTDTNKGAATIINFRIPGLTTVFRRVSFVFI